MESRQFQTGLLIVILVVVAGIGGILYAQRDRPWSDTKCMEVAMKLDAGRVTESRDRFAEECL